MAGQIKALIDQIVSTRAQGNPVVELTTKAKLTLKGINVDKFDASSPDDPKVLADLRRAAAEMGVDIH